MSRSSSQLRRRKLAHQQLDQRQLLAGDIQLVSDGFTIQQNAAQISFDVLANDKFSEDYDGVRRITHVTTGSQGGQIRIADDGGSLLYTAPADFAGEEVFHYYVDRDKAAIVNVSIESPLPEFRQLILRMQDEYEFDLLEGAKFSDDYAGEKRITVLGISSVGADLQVSDDGQSVSYRPPIGVSGMDSFTYIVDNRFFAIARIEIENVLGRDRFEVLQHSDTTNLDLLSNDFLEHGSEIGRLADEAKITHLLSTSQDFEVEIADDGHSVNFTPIDDYYGAASFRYVVNSRFEQNVTVYTQRPVRDDYFNADQNGGQHSLDVLQNDNYRQFNEYWSVVDVVDVVTAVEQGDAGGAVVISDGGATVSYTPPVGFTGTETFRYTADGKYTATVKVNVTAPVRDDFPVVFIDTETPIDVLANDFYGDSGAGAVISSIGDSEIGASIRLGDDGFIYYTPPGELDDFSVRDNFEYTVNGFATASVRVWFRRITNADYIDVDHAVTKTIDVLGNDSFDEGYQGQVRITGVSAPSDGGTVTISENGKFLIYTPGAIGETFDYTVDDRFTETVTSRQIRRLEDDHAVTDQNSTAIVIDVLANDFNPRYINEHYGPYTGDRVLTGVATSDAGGAVGIVDGKIRYTPPADFVGRDRFEYMVDDFLSATVTVNVVRRADDDLVRVNPDSQDNQLKVLVNDLLGADYEGAGVITAVDGSNGALQIADDGRSIFYTPEQGFVGEDQFVYTVDGKSKATVTVIVQDRLENALPQFESIEQLRDHLLELSIDRWYGNDRYYGVTDFAFAASAPDFSETNVQVAGVDEDDLVETDGDFIYSLRDDELAIVSSLAEGEMDLMSQTAIEGQAIGMYLNGDRLTVVSKLFDLGYPEPLDDLRVAENSFVSDQFISLPRPTNVNTIVTVFDVSDRGKPDLVQQTKMDGGFLSSRRIDDQVFLVLNSGDLFFEPEEVCDDQGDCAGETKEEFVARVQSNYAELLEDILPSYESVGADSRVVRSGRLLVPEDIYLTGENAASMTLVVSLNMATTEPGLASTSGVMTAKGGSIYANANSLYIFKPAYDPQDQQPATEILKFDWDGKSGEIQFAATGTVAGRLLDQFSADQQGEVLRITTSISNRGTGTFSGDAETAVFTLLDNQGVLEFVGSLQNIAPGEDVKSVRYFGDRAFVTTFRTIDPLFAVNLSDPSDPWLMGHASIPGFSNYAQIISEDRLLTVGSDRGTTIVSLFDVGDFANPELIDLYQLPRYTTSEANLDHHAFGWFARHEILALPTGQVFSERWDEDNDGYPEATRRIDRDALTMLHVGIDDISGAKGVTLRGRIQHTAKVIRSVYIGEFVYSVGMDAVRAVRVGAEETVVDQVVYPIDQEPMDPPWNPGASLTKIAVAARGRLADAMQVDHGRVMVVAQESSGQMIETVLRVGDNHYRYSGEDADDLSLIDSAFAFVDGWQNEANQWDVNDDGEVTALDALLAINALGRLGGGDLPADRVMRQVTGVTKYVDTNGDGKLTALDALRVINRIATNEAEREQPNADSVAVYPARQVFAETDDDDVRNSVTTIAADSPAKL